MTMMTTMAAMTMRVALDAIVREKRASARGDVSSRRGNSEETCRLLVGDVSKSSATIRALALLGCGDLRAHRSFVAQGYTDDCIRIESNRIKDKNEKPQ